MAPAIPCALTLLLSAACWRQVSGESLFLSRRSNLTVPSGISAALSEEGYQQVASLKSDEQMNEFVLRVLQKNGLEGNTSYIQGLVPWYSGTRAVQSLASLRKELTEKPWVRRISQTSFIRKSFELDGQNVSGDVLSNVSNKLTVATTSPSAQSNFMNNSSSELHVEKAYVKAEDQEERSSSQACSPQCYTGHRATAAWKEDKCHHQHCFRCPECEVNQLTQELNPSNGSGFHDTESYVQAVDKEKNASSRVCLSLCHIGKSATASWKEQACHHQNCSGCPECDARQTAQELNSSNVSRLGAEESHVRLEEKDNGTAPTSREMQRHTPNSLTNGSNVLRNSTYFLNTSSTQSKSTSDTINHLGPRVTAAGAVNTNPSAATTPAVKATRLRKKWIKPHVERSHMKAQNKKQPAPKLYSFNGSELHDKEFRVNAKNKKSGTLPTVREAQRHKLQETQPSFDATVAAAVPDNIVTLREPEESMQGTVQTMSARMRQGDETHENGSLERKTMAIVANPDTSSQVVTTVRTAEANKPGPSFETDLVVIPHPDKTSNSEVSNESRPTPQLSNTSKHVNVAEAQPSFAAKIAAAVVADSTSTPREPDEIMQDTAQLSESRLLPDVPSLLDKSNHVREVLNKQVSALKEQLTEAELESQKAVANKKYEYERILEHQIENSTSIAKANEQLGRETQTLREQNVELRNRAMQLKAKGAQLHKHMLDIKANLTLAQEFAEGALTSDTNKSALLVLRQLDEQDVALAKSKAHAAALRQVSTVLLQTSSRTASADIFEVVSNLREKFDDLDREKGASMAALKQTFEEQFSKELQRQDALKEKGHQLKTDRDGQLALREKLQAAVNHLDHAVLSLEQQIQGLQAYAEQLSSTH